jgi:peptidoglycan/xylan/chitin deacetylase (PgdA/CDA1 family)
MIFFISASIGLLGATLYFSPWAWRQYRMELVRRQITERRLLILTYDDGPSAGVTSQLLDLLRKHKTCATFFMLGENAEKHPEIVDRVVREGHDVGCHSNRHLSAWKSSPWKGVADIREGYDRLSRWIRPNAMYRPPYGKLTLPTYYEVRRRGAPVWWWTIDSGDTNGILPNSAEVIDRVRKENGGIVLMHDLDRTPQRTKFVLELTAALLDVAAQEKLKVVPLRELC